MGLYLLLQDLPLNPSFEPALYDYQQTGANVLFFTFIHPRGMEVPDTFKKLAASRGTDKPGAVPEGHIILFAIGGISWSKGYNPWDWLTSQEKAEAMAARVARWPEEFPGCDGIDLDLENGAGEAPNAGTNMVHFVKKIHQIRKSEGKFRMIISQPTFGFPQVWSKNRINLSMCK